MNGLMRATIVAAALAGAWPARAEPARDKVIALSWVRRDGAEPCASAQEMAVAVEKLVGDVVFVAPRGATLSVEGWVEHRDGSFRAEIRLVDAAGATLGTREIERDGPSCAALTLPASLAIALLLEPDGARPTPRPSAPKPAAPIPAPPCPPQPRSAAPRERPPGLSLDVLIGGAVGLGVLPEPAVALTAGLHLRTPSRWDFGLNGALYHEQSVPIRPTAAAHFWLAEIEPSACYAPLAETWARIAACAAPTFSYLRVHASGLRDASQVDVLVPVGALAMRSRLIDARRGLSLGLDVSLGLPLRRDPYRYDDERGASRELFRMAPVVGRVSLNAGVTFP
jgi:hypothetical protein